MIGQKWSVALLFALLFTGCSLLQKAEKALPQCSVTTDVIIIKKLKLKSEKKSGSSFSLGKLTADFTNDSVRYKTVVRVLGTGVNESTCDPGLVRDQEYVVKVTDKKFVMVEQGDKKIV